MKTLHRLVSLTVATAAPAAVYLANGEIRFEFIILGAVMGVAYWYWGPTGALL